MRVDQQEAASGRVDGGRIWGLKCPCAEDTSSVSWRENRSHKDSRGQSTRPVQTGILRSLGTWTRPLLLYLSRLSGREEMRGHWRAWFIAWYKWHSVSLYLLPVEVGSASWWVYTVLGRQAAIRGFWSYRWYLFTAISQEAARAHGILQPHDTQIEIWGFSTVMRTLQKSAGLRVRDWELSFEIWDIPQRTPVGGEMVGSLGGGISLKEVGHWPCVHHRTIGWNFETENPSKALLFLSDSLRHFVTVQRVRHVEDSRRGVEWCPER